MALATLSIDLVAKLASFEQDMGKAARAAEKTASQISGAFGVIKAAAGGLVAGIGVGGLVAFTRSTIDALDALNDVKDATGASIENISALEDVAVRTGTTLDTVTGSLVKFNQALNTAKPGSDAALAMERLGLSVKELRELDPAEALRRTAVALSGFADDGDKARLTQELFGKSLQQVAPFLADLAKQGGLVAKVTSEQVAEAEKFNLQLFEMQKNAQDLSRLLVSDLVTGINKAAAALKESGLIEGFRTLFTGDDRYKNNKALTEQTEILLNLEKALQDQRGQGFAEDSRVVTNTKAQIAGIKEQIRVTQNYRKVLDDFGGPVPGAALPSVGGSAGGSTKGRPKLPPEIKSADFVTPITTELDRYLSSLEQAIEKQQELSAVQTAQLRISEAGANGFSEAQRTRILALAAEIDKQRELKDAMKATNDAQEERIRIGREVAIAQGVDNGPRAERLKGLLSSTDEERFARIREDVTLLAEEFTAGRLQGGAEQYIQAIKGLVGETGDAIEKTKSVVDDLGLSFSSAFEDAIVGGKSFQDVLKGIGQDILRISVRKAVTEPLGGFFSKALSGFFSKALSGIFSLDGGGYTGGSARSGGLDGKGGFMAMLHPQETVIDHTKGGSTGGTVVVNINQQVGDIATVSMLQRSNESLVRQIQGGLMRSQNYGGALA